MAAKARMDAREAAAAQIAAQRSPAPELSAAPRLPPRTARNDYDAGATYGARMESVQPANAENAVRRRFDTGSSGFDGDAGALWHANSSRLQQIQRPFANNDHQYGRDFQQQQSLPHRSQQPQHPPPALHHNAYAAGARIDAASR
eukprot:3215577-Pleurochrysis_carterae.AAC.1